VVKDTPILILDEPTAALDAETELKLIRNLSEWGKERVIFLITHRLSTIRSADQIVYIDNGCILEAGSHDDLMKIENGHYRGFVETEETMTKSRRNP
jgi:ABC-type multidrug transport system fused ATPase/permease subunit